MNGYRAFGKRGSLAPLAFVVALTSTMSASRTAKAQDPTFTSSYVSTIVNPTAGVVSTDGRWLYTAHGNGLVAVVDLLGETPLGFVDTNPFVRTYGGLSSIAYLDGRILVETEHALMRVTAGDGLSNAHVDTVSLGPGWGVPGGRLAITPDQSLVCVVSGSIDDLILLDARSLEERGRVPIGIAHTDISLSSDGTRAYAFDGGLGTLAVVDLVNRRVETLSHYDGGITNAGYPCQSSTRRNGDVYVLWQAADGANRLSVLDARGALRSVTVVPGTASGMALSPDDRYVMLGDGYILDADTLQTVGEVEHHADASQTWFSPNGAQAYIASHWSNLVERVSGFPGSLQVPESPRLGTTVNITLNCPRQAGGWYQLVASSNEELWRLSNGMTIPLQRDSLFQHSLRGPYPTMHSFVGRLGASGSASAQLQLAPGTPGLSVGSRVHFMFAVFRDDTRRAPAVVFVSEVRDAAISR